MLPTYLKNPDGSVYINPAKRHVKPYWLTTEAITIPPEIVVLAAGATSPPITMPIDTQGHFEAFYSMADRTGAATILLFDPGTNRFLMNREIHIDTIVSGGGGAGVAAGFGAARPFIWPESYFFNVEDAGRAVIATFRDLSGAPNNIRFTLHGRRFYTKESPPEVYQKMYEYFGRKERTNIYFLTTDAAALIPAGGVLASTARVTDEADFEIYKVNVVSDGAFTFRLRDVATNRTLSNGVISNTIGSGVAEFPFIFPEPWLVERNYQIGIEMTDLSAAPNNVFMTFIGRRLYYAQ